MPRFPPHERGWTRPVEFDYRHENVSPARAGMDLTVRYELRKLASFPRTSGDGPSLRNSFPSIELFPPHERGWTRIAKAVSNGKPVSPARAGMDLGGGVRRGFARGFPRTSGDGPYTRIKPVQSYPFPPHERGWTFSATGRKIEVRVSPARAGMDLPKPPTFYPPPRFPRTSGDGPPVYAKAKAALEFPPHERGWTPCGRLALWNSPVSPARAGMDLSLRSSALGSHGFPRTSGDGPVPIEPVNSCYRFPPHERGWTRLTSNKRPGFGVSPARAGMDLFHATESDACMSFPRERGWTSGRVVVWAGYLVSPARAGMDPAAPTTSTAAE